MNKTEYNNIIDWTLDHDETVATGDSLTVARAIFNNMGVALPQGSCREVLEILRSNEYMGWESCTAKEAQEAANCGVAAIGINANRIVVLSAEEGEEDVSELREANEAESVVENVTVMTLRASSKESTEEEMEFFSYSSARITTSDTGSGHKAIIIVPGVMGTELELAEDTDLFPAGTKVWPPCEEGEDPGITAAYKLAELQCDTNGNSIHRLRVRNSNNYGAYETYKSLYNNLRYEYGGSYDVIFFGYDWRKPNSVSGAALRSLVYEYESVIIVAHSMGGLVVSHMLTNEAIRSRVDKVITLGTPFLGSLEMLTVMSHGELPIVDQVLSRWNKALAYVAKEVVLQPMLKQMAVNVPSLYELLPTKKFFSINNRSYYSIWYLLDGEVMYDTFDLTRSFLAAAIDNYNIDLFDAATSRNDMLWTGNLHVTGNVDTYYIMGENIDTTCTYCYNQVTGEYTITDVTTGDGTVLTYSAGMYDKYPTKTFYVSLNHDELVSSSTVLGFVGNIIDGNTIMPNGVRPTPEAIP